MPGAQGAHRYDVRRSGLSELSTKVETMTGITTPLAGITAAAAEMVDRAADPDTTEAGFGLMGLDQAGEVIEAARRDAIAHMRANGATWARIAACLGITVQAVHGGRPGYGRNLPSGLDVVAGNAAFPAATALRV